MMDWRRSPLTSLRVTVALASICQSCALEATDETSAVAQELSGGAPDVEHAAVAIVRGAHGACTATIIHVADGVGTALTAAHCVQEAPSVLQSGADLDVPEVEYPVFEVIQHPAYDGGLHDFALVRFSGATATTPFIAPLSPGDDALQPGTSLTFVGYDWTQAGSRLRLSSSLGVSALGTWLVEYAQPDGGPCHGDSGGPALVRVGTEERVAGVTAYGDPNCVKYGASGRVSTVHDGFLLPNLAPGSEVKSCEECQNLAGGAACAVEGERCLANVRCSELQHCAETCTDSAPCITACQKEFADALADYLDLQQCRCGRACPHECAESLSCAKPLCGMRAKWQSCQGCLEQSCCAEGLRRTYDTASGSDELEACLAGECEDECRGTELLPRTPRFHVPATEHEAEASCSISGEHDPRLAVGTLLVSGLLACRRRLRRRGRT